MRIQAFDIGGAYIKTHYHDGTKGSSTLYYFPFWKRVNELEETLRHLEKRSDKTVITMTAELSDSFSTKDEGTKFISRICEQVFETPFFLTKYSRLKGLAQIKRDTEIGATNWLASLYLMKKRFEKGILLDIGSTTTDLLPFRNEKTPFKSDLERLREGWLLYTGLLRTPLNTIVQQIPMDGVMVPVSSEYFTITADLYKILWNVEYSCETPDGKGKSRKDSLTRLARLLCAEPEELGDKVLGICRYIHQTQVGLISGALERLSNERGLKTVYACGIGWKLGVEAADKAGLETVLLEEELKDAWNLPCLGMVEMAIDML